MKTNRILTIGYLVMIGAFMCIGLFQCQSGKKQDETDNEQPDLASRFKNLHDSMEYVGMQKCRQCHSDVYESFKKTGMGQSFGPATPEVSDADFSNHPTVYDSFKDFYYTSFWRDSSLYIKEYRLEDGDTVHKRVQLIDYVIGSGHHTNSHIYSTNGYLYQAPMTFYTQDQEWDLPPGFENGNNTRFSRKIGNECMTCHNMYPEFEELSVNKYHKVPDGIACERCHGPGELHVKAKQRTEISDSGSIVNPAKLPASRKNDVCQRCHLQGNAVLKEGKTFFDFKPGMKLSSVMTVFRPQFKEEGAFIMASHSERMQESECYKATRASNSFETLNCITCHNPHKSVKVTEDQYFNKTCKDCHNPDQSEKAEMVVCQASDAHKAKNDNNCVKCHMPKSGSVDIPHVSIHDHNIRVQDSAENTDKFSGDIKDLTVSKLKSYNADNPDHETMAKAYLYYFEKFRAKPRFLDSARFYLDRLSKDSMQGEWVQYYFLQQDERKLVNFIEQQDSLRFSSANAHYQAGQAYYDFQRWDQALKHFKKAVNQEPYNLDYRNKLASVYIRKRQLGQAQKQLDFIMKENPELAFAQNNQGFLYLARQKMEKARHHLDKALTLNPDYGQAHLNLGKWHLGMGQKAKARAKVEMVKKDFPDLRQEANLFLEMLDQRGQL